jgi:hypothetical protein
MQKARREAFCRHCRSCRVDRNGCGTGEVPQPQSFEPGTIDQADLRQGTGIDARSL